MEELVIWGAGAIGGTIGAALARAGKDPLLVDAAEEHVTAMKSAGLKVTGPHEDYTAKVRAAAPAEVRGPLRRVMLAVKSQHTTAAARTIRRSVSRADPYVCGRFGNQLWCIGIKIAMRA